MSCSSTYGIYSRDNLGHKSAHGSDLLHAAVEVHSINTNSRIIFDTEIDVLGNTETKVASLREVAGSQLVFLDFQTSLDNFLGLGTSDGDVNCDLFVSSDTKRSDGVSSLACERELLASVFDYCT